MNKKIIVGIVAVALLVILGLSFGGGENKKVKIGIVGHFSGDYASYGVPMKNGMILALNQQDQEHKKYEVIVEDDGANASQAASAVNKLVNVDKVNYLLSAQGSGATSVIIPITESNKKILLVTLASAPDLLKDTKYVFRSVPSDIYQGVKMVSYATDVLQTQKVAGLYANDPYGTGIKNMIEAGSKGASVLSELFTPGANDFRTSLLKIKSEQPDTVVLAARENEYPLILRQIKELDIKANIIASETFKDDKILANAGKSADGVVTFMAEPKDYVNFAAEYEKAYAEAPSAYSMYGYDGMMALVTTLSRAGDNVEYSAYKVISGRFVRL